MEKSAAKRSSATVAGGEMGVLDGIKAVIVEMDGVIVSSSFFLDVLLKYTMDNVGAYVKEHYNKQSVKEIIEALRAQAAKDVEAKKEGAVVIPTSEGEGEDPAVTSAVEIYVKWQMSNCDCMTEAGEDMFSEIIKSAYKDGKLKGKLCEDAAEGLRSLSKTGVKMYVFSDYCADTSKLSLQYSTAGDLTDLFTGWYDFRFVGKESVFPMKVGETYKKFADELKVDVTEILYITHKSSEVVAAVGAGAKAVLVEHKFAKPKLGHDEEPEVEVDIGDAPSFKRLTDLCMGGVESPTKKQRTEEDTSSKKCVETGCDDAPKQSQ